MLPFDTAVNAVEATGTPVAEGIAFSIRSGGSKTREAVRSALPPGAGSWKPEQVAGEWWAFAGDDHQTVSLAAAWESIRRIRAIQGVSEAEPLLLTRVLLVDGAEARRAFELWGRVGSQRLAEIQQASKPTHWSLETLRVGDAWKTWASKHGKAKRPGDGIVIAHPDAGYTKHGRLVPHLVPRSGVPGRYGWNFVDRNAADALDPMTDRRVAHHPGHGTATASVIAAGSTAKGEPWGVAPGAKILPLRVSTSVIHLSFDNLRRALQKALDEGAHVVSMSLGGPHDSGALAALIRSLLDAGILVVAAAGNQAPTVVFPARLPGVIACAASNALDGPWRFSGLGARVAVSAPGELVWHDDSDLGADGQPRYGADAGSGTSYATANVAGLAALWLSYHGRDALIKGPCDRDPALLPFLFRLCLQGSARKEPTFLKEGKAGFGTGIADADQLLHHSLPAAATVRKERNARLAEAADKLVGFPIKNWWTVLTLPTFAGNEVRLTDAGQRAEALGELIEKLVPGADEMDRAEIGGLAASDVDLAIALLRKMREGEGVPAAALRRHLLRRPDQLSPTLEKKLRQAQSDASERWLREHGELAVRSGTPRSRTTRKGASTAAYAVDPPAVRRLRAFAFDPSLATRFAEAGSNEITIPVVFEHDLLPGPVGDYLEVVDVDPASDCVYAPVDLDHPHLLAQDGLPRSEGNPQFHQQMVYAVAMKTIGHFETALGRPIFWSPLRPWDKDSGDLERAASKSGKRHDRFVRRLRIYPHALRGQNAYYSPQKRAILFGYFPAGDGDAGAERPGGVVFTCLAHDIIAHEVTHAILDGMHVHFIERTNPDVLAFHEAFADLVALLQRFTYTDLVRDQIARARGNLNAGTLLTRLGIQFGETTGRGQALRDALGFAVDQRRKKGDDEWRDALRRSEAGADGTARPSIADSVRKLSDHERREVWKRFEADPTLIERVEEPHARGSFLVAAVFDAYIRIYEDRVADLQRIASGGTGELPEGDLHPDLVARMADEACKVAGRILRMCIRAMDYVPPLDITFGEFLRALITADYDLMPDDPRRYRVAFVEAFRKWGIYPRDVQTLSEESLRWSAPKVSLALDLKSDALDKAREALLAWQPGAPREEIFHQIREGQAALHDYLKHEMDDKARREVLQGIDTTKSFQVTNLRPARRIRPGGRFSTEMVVEVIQTPARAKEEDADERVVPSGPPWPPFRGGVTLIVGLDHGTYTVRYAIYKRATSRQREARQREFELRASGGGGEAAEYSTHGLPPRWYSGDEARRAWLAGRTSRLDDMRALLLRLPPGGDGEGGEPRGPRAVRIPPRKLTEKGNRMPENNRLLPARKEIKVRLYGQGLGDCFLLAFPREDAENPCYMVIDCGAALSTPDRSDRARNVVANIHAATGGHLDVLAITHQHYDHISGFDDAWAEWKTLTVDSLYLPWTESDSPTGDHTTVGKLREALDRAARKALERASAADLAAEPAFIAQADFLGVDLDGGGLAAAGGMDGTMERIRSLCAPDRVRYFEPGDVFQLPGTASHGYVLGPPLPDKTDHRGKKLIELLVDEDDEVMYSYGQLGMPVDDGKPGGATAFAVGDDRSLPALASGLLAADLVDREVDEGFCPFGSRVRLDWDSAMGSKFFARHYGEDSGGENGSWRRIDDEWLAQAGALALRAGGFTNNLSLVLAFDVPGSPKMLLFAGDAQVGNWLSWHTIDGWRFRNGSVPDRPPTPGDSKTLMEDLLSRVVFYKVGHHASHNATIRTKGLEAMTRDDLVAYIPVSVPIAQDRMSYCPMPFYPVVRALHRRTRGRTFLPNGQAVKVGDSSDRPEKVLRKEAGMRVAKEQQKPLEVNGTEESLPLYLELTVKA